MMSGQARSSVTIMGLDTHMILETVPVPRSPRRTAHHAINRSSRHGVGGAFLVEVILITSERYPVGSAARNAWTTGASSAASSTRPRWPP